MKPHARTGLAAPSRPAAPVRSVLERACSPAGTCSAAIVIGITSRSGQSLARVGRRGPTAGEIDGVRESCRTGSAVTLEHDADTVSVAVPAGTARGVVVRVARPLTADRIELALSLGRSVQLAADNEWLARERRRLVGELVDAEQRRYVGAAHDLHDGPAQSLLWCRNTLRALIDQETALPVATLAEAASAVDEALDDLRSSIARLHAEPTTEHPLADLLRDEVSRLRRREGAAVELDLRGTPVTDPTVALTVYRIAQEALTNAVRHGGATRLRVSIVTGERSILMGVVDNGRGFSAAGAAGTVESPGLGLHGMRERADLLGGVLTVTSRPGGPTIVHADLPLRIDA